MKKTLMLLAMVVALVILPFLLTMAVNMAVQTAKRKARFRLLRRSINPGFSRYMNLPAVKLKACCLPFRALLARR
ncbi:hypothetical protein SEEH3712_09103 [Salmonella enterica subsp. enterica serovar Heidelberg str. 622737-12]|nr:hypothetical protein SEEACDC2_18749 [Salmonella enterica subsp. enterica serovar Agona str. SA-2]KJT49625.1 hypothetical protein SEEH4588_21233 [Salmonella enterica subsp. enterica serovar Heidelberg str. RI-11-014588]KJT65747.1 hypothetical protein SEEH3712_09103 [Salmonella enterica subsp. enterica serovar Heidelberg str. 622737-12]